MADLSSRQVTQQLLNALAGEIARANKIQDTNDPAFRFRILVRVLFSCIDAFCFHIKALTLESFTSAGVSFSKNDFEVLRESRETTDNDGQPVWKPLMIGTKKNIVTTLRCYAKARNVKCPLPPSGDIPEYVLKSIKIRNRLTHPKAPQDFDISKEEADALASTNRWFIEMLTWVKQVETDYIKSIQTYVHNSIQNLIDKMRNETEKGK